MPASAYRLDEVNAILQLGNGYPGTDSVLVTYRVFPFRINATSRRLNYDSIRNNFLAEQPVIIRSSAKPGESFNLISAVSVLKAVSGDQSLWQQPGRSCQFNHEYAAQRIYWRQPELTAAITDNNLPIQPDGNTRTS